MRDKKIAKTASGESKRCTLYISKLGINTEGARRDRPASRSGQGALDARLDGLSKWRWVEGKISAVVQDELRKRP